MNKFSEFNNIFIQYIFVLVTKSYLRFNRPNPRSFNKIIIHQFIIYYK